MLPELTANSMGTLPAAAMHRMTVVPARRGRPLSDRWAATGMRPRAKDKLARVMPAEQQHSVQDSVLPAAHMQIQYNTLEELYPWQGRSPLSALQYHVRTFIG